MCSVIAAITHTLHEPTNLFCVYLHVNSIFAEVVGRTHAGHLGKAFAVRGQFPWPMHLKSRFVCPHCSVRQLVKKFAWQKNFWNLFCIWKLALVSTNWLWWSSVDSSVELGFYPKKKRKCLGHGSIVHNCDASVGQSQSGPLLLTKILQLRWTPTWSAQNGRKPWLSLVFPTTSEKKEFVSASLDNLFERMPFHLIWPHL